MTAEQSRTLAVIEARGGDYATEPEINGSLLFTFDGSTWSGAVDLDGAIVSVER